MSTDRYTRVVLTIIAACLVSLGPLACAPQQYQDRYGNLWDFCSVHQALRRQTYRRGELWIETDRYWMYAMAEQGQMQMLETSGPWDQAEVRFAEICKAERLKPLCPKDGRRRRRRWAQDRPG